ncbi:MAG TPA: hypothetical protein DCY07_04385, partial [Rhodospirillaceae bacterium]|nr:hypothetical protein [Rhodospirillaceae bacterium]
SPDLAVPLHKNWPLFVLAGLVPDGEYATGLSEWLKASLNDNAAANKEEGNRLQVLREKAGQTLLVLSAAGYAVPEEAWHRVMETVPPTKQLTPSPVLLDIMKQAAAAGRTGETALLSLLLVDGSASEAILGVKVEVIRALRLVGLTAEAQGLAREVVVGLN